MEKAIKKLLAIVVVIIFFLTNITYAGSFQTVSTLRKQAASLTDIGESIKDGLLDMHKKTSSAGKVTPQQAFSSPELFEQFIPQELQRLLAPYKGKPLSASLAGPANEYQGTIGRSSVVHKLKPSLDKESPEAKNTAKFVLDGDIINQCVYAGAATRAAALLGGSSKFTFNPAGVKNLNPDDFDPEVAAVIREAQKLDYINSLKSFTLGARMFIQYRVTLEKLAEESGYDKKKAVSNAKFIVHINDQSVDSIIEEFIQYNFFGFNPDNIVFVIQPTFEGYIKDSQGNLVKYTRPDSKQWRRPFGHGYTLMQIVMPNQGFIVKGGRKISVQESPLEYFKRISPEVNLVANRPIEDLTKLTDDTINLNKLALILGLREQGHLVIAELVDNATGQKGASWHNSPDNTDISFLVETLQTKNKMLVRNRYTGEYFYISKNDFNSDTHEAITDANEQKRIFKEYFPLNKNANAYDTNGLLRYLKLKPLKNYLDIREDAENNNTPVAFMESITGDVSQIPEMNSAAINNPGEAITAFKEAKDLIKTLEYMHAQDKNPDFARIADEAASFKASSSGEMITRDEFKSIFANVILKELKQQNADTKLVPVYYRYFFESHGVVANMPLDIMKIHLSIERAFSDTKERFPDAKWQSSDISPIKLEDHRIKKATCEMVIDRLGLGNQTKSSSLITENIKDLLEKDGIKVAGEDAEIIGKVMQRLLSHPETRAKDICKDLNISKEGLINTYRIIKSSNVLREFLITGSVDPILAKELLYLLENRGFLDRYFKGEVVYPLIVEFHTGEWCPHSCVFCYSKHDKDNPFVYKDRKLPRKPLSASDANRLVNEFAERGAKRLWISGGLEPLSVKESVFAAIVEAGRENGLEIRLYTNGELLGVKSRNVCLECDWIRFDISGVTEEMFNAVHRPVSDKYNFERVINNVKEFFKLKQEQGSKVKVGMCYLVIPDPANYKDLIKAADFAYMMGFDFFSVRVDMGSVVRRFNDSEIDEILKQISRISEKGKQGEYGKMELDLRGMQKDELKIKEVRPDMQEAEYCYARLFKMVINPYGVGFICDYVEHPRNSRLELEVGDFVTDGVDKVIQRSMGIRHKVEDCKNCGIDCLIHERGTNTLIEKLESDYQFGISLDQQPFIAGLGKTVEYFREKAKSSSSGTTLDELLGSQLSKAEAVDFVINYAYTPKGAEEVPQNLIGKVVYSDSLRQDAHMLSRVKQSPEMYLLINKETDEAQLLKDLGIQKQDLLHVLNKGQLTAEHAALSALTFLHKKGIRQVRVFANTKEDMDAWTREEIKGFVDTILVLLLTDKRFEIISDYSQKHMEYIRTHKQALIAA